jgi:hypothetical protein
MRHKKYFILSSSAAQRGLWPSHSRGFVITHNDAPQSVGLLWTSDQLVAETSTWQYTTNIHVLGGIRTHDRSRRAAVDLHLRPSSHWDRRHKKNSTPIGLVEGWSENCFLVKISKRVYPGWQCDCWGEQQSAACFGFLYGSESIVRTQQQFRMRLNGRQVPSWRTS